MAVRYLRKFKYEDLVPAKPEGAPSGGKSQNARASAQKKPPNILRVRSREVHQADGRIRAFIEDMVETMRAAKGAGLAAIQVGVPRRIIVIEYGGVLLKLINPVIIESSGERLGFENCLSIPGVTGLVRRPERVVVKAYNERGLPVRVEGRQRLASALCHEIDHLDGVLFIDKIIPGTLILERPRET